MRLEEEMTMSTFRTKITTLLLAVGGALIFSTGLSMRIDLDSLPDLWRGRRASNEFPNGTAPGFLLATPILLASLPTYPGSDLLFYVAAGGLVFATGATNLTLRR